jgi:peroxiredoxin
MRLYATASGGKEQALQNELARLQFPYDKAFMKTYDSIRLKQYKDDDDKKRMIKLFDSTQDMSQSIYVEFGKTHPNSYLGLDILYRNREHIAADSLKQLYHVLDSSLKYTTKAEGIRTFLYGEQATKGKMLIDFAVHTIDGKPFRLSSLKGNYILLSFWSAGCAPCRMENKKMSKDYNRYDNKIAIVSFSIDKNKDAWVKASQSDNIRWINISDLEGSSGTIKTKYNVQAIPTSFLINKEGLIIERFVGFDEDFNSKLNTLLSQQ